MKNEHAYYKSINRRTHLPSCSCVDWRFKIKRIKQSKILPSKWVNEQSNTSYLLCFAYWNDILIPQAFFLIDITQRKFFGKSRHMKCNVHNQMLSKGCSYPIRKVQRFKIKSGIYFFLYRKQTLSTLQQKQCALTTRNAKKVFVRQEEQMKKIFQGQMMLHFEVLQM